MILPPRLPRRTFVAAAGLLAAAPALARPKEAYAMSRLYPVLQGVIGAWRTQDVEGVLSHVTDDIVWQNSAGHDAPITGKPAMRAVLQTMGAKIKTSRWRIFDYAENGDRLFMEGVD